MFGNIKFEGLFGNKANKKVISTIDFIIFHIEEDKIAYQYPIKIIIKKNSFFVFEDKNVI